MANEVYTDYESGQGEIYDKMSDESPVARYWNDEHRLRDTAISMTVQHFMNKENVSQKTFQEHLELIYNFLKTGKV